MLLCGFFELIHFIFFSPKYQNAMGLGGRPTRSDSSKDQVQVKITPNDSESPEIRKYKKRFTSDILCAALWGVNLLIGTEAGLMLLDRSGQGKG